MHRIALFSILSKENDMGQWTFITHHAAVLALMAVNPRITARDLSQRVGITERSIRTIISDLEQEGYIAKKREGRNVSYTVNPDRSLRHALQKDKAVGLLLTVLSGSPIPSPNGSDPPSLTQ
jgi:DNA-binding MarR family transcriptional regulator